MKEVRLPFEKTKAIKNEPLWIDSAAVEVKMQTVKAYEQASVEAIPAQPIRIKQELETDQYFKDIEDCQELNIKKECKDEFIHSEIDLPILKSENIFETDCNKKFKITPRRIKFPCPVCKKCYSSCKSRKNHFIKHFMKESVLCYCGKSFTEAFLFLRHYFVHLVKKSNQILNSPTRKCKKSKFGISHLFGNCLQPLSYIKMFYRHSRIHAGERPYQCKICLKHFNSKQGLASHSRTHKKPYQCKICPKQFSQKRSLTIHKICLKHFSPHEV